ncbi:deoxynucleotidyltransferase terminal-interacting protein 2 [Lasioglossum baleicum]|uniref:deoxynucleotidyltransferase terminal-interacting protein 2 n=1 Tax=Lasioglossum baleicum TaxID=434251 RepID=UPI003FCD1F52
MDIIIDTRGDANLVTRDQLIESDEDDLDFSKTGRRSSNFFKVEEDLINNADTSKKKQRHNTKDIDLEEFEVEMGWNRKKKATKRAKKKSTKKPVAVTNNKTAIDEILQKSVIKPGIEQLESLPSGRMGKKQLQLLKRKEREKTKGKDWFNMRAPEMTPEIKHDLEVLQMRSVLDPKHFYKKNDLKVLPKYFQIGKVLDSPVDYYSSRLTKKERKQTIVDELMADAEFAKYNKRKYKEIIDEKKKLHYKAHKHAKRLKGKKK